jgi:O-sialoglycoprotein endopeptidase (EC 3.4.24.57)
MKVLGIESTAHTLGIGIVDEEDVLANAKDMFEPEEGGFRPREAAEHHYKSFLEVLNQAEQESGLEVSDVGAVAYSRGPGLPQCLDTGAVAARTLSLKHGVPLVGVNHCLAHISIGTRTTDAERPVTLYVSGGNTQLIFRNQGRYRVVGETLDIAVGNAVDKLARHLDVPYPGGPEIERLADEQTRYSRRPTRSKEWTSRSRDWSPSSSGLTTERK